MLSLSLALLLGLYGLQLILSEAHDTPISLPDFRTPERLEPDPPGAPPPRLRIVLTPPAAVTNHPETWGALQTTATAPVAAAPLADPSTTPHDTIGCRDVATLAGQMTCIDPTLGEAETRLGTAYDAVLAAGVSPQALGRSQARWLATRDAAARSSPEDLLAAYQLREEQLRNLATALMRRAGSVGLVDAAKLNAVQKPG